MSGYGFKNDGIQSGKVNRLEKKYISGDSLYTPPPPVEEAKSDPAANITFNGSSIVERKDGKKLWELSAESVQVDPNSKKVSLNNLKGILYREDGGRIDLVAREGLYDTASKEIFLEGEVKAVSSDGAVFTAAKARWATTERHMYGSGGITLTREDTVITGDKIDSDANMEKVKVQGNARAIKGGVPQ
jgi:LPS export ABC transporter protein LptC